MRHFLSLKRAVYELDFQLVEEFEKVTCQQNGKKEDLIMTLKKAAEQAYANF